VFNVCFRREVNENCALQGYYAASSGNLLSTFRDNLSVPFGFLNPEDGTDKSSPVTGLEWPRGFQEVKVPRFHVNGAGWW